MKTIHLIAKGQKGRFVGRKDGKKIIMVNPGKRPKRFVTPWKPGDKK